MYRLALVRLASLLAASSFALVIGCGRATSPTQIAGSIFDGADNAAIAFDAANQDLQVADSLRHGPCGSFGFPLGIPGGCPFDAASSSFTCGPNLRENGVTETRSYQFLDALGAAQSAYDSLTTASIRFASHLNGTRSHDDRVLTIDDSRELVESGLAGSETTRIWNGSGSSSRRDSSASTGSAIGVLSTTTVSDVVVPTPFARDSWPLSGTITTHRVSNDGSDVISVITFNGTRYVPMTVGDITVTIDLARGHFGGGPHGDGPIAGGPRGPGGHHGRR